MLQLWLRFSLLSILALLMMGLWIAPPPLLAQTFQTSQTSQSQEPIDEIFLNFRNTSIDRVITTFAEVLNKDFLVDEEVSGEITFISNQPITGGNIQAVFDLFLDSQGLVAVELNGGVTRISVMGDLAPLRSDIHQKSPQTHPINDRLITKVITIKHLDVGEVVASLDSFFATRALIKSHPTTNSLLIKAKQQDVDEFERILVQLDKPLPQLGFEVIELEHILANELVGILSQFQINQSNPKSNAKAWKVVAQSEPNQIIIQADLSQLLSLRTLISVLDAPFKNNPNAKPQLSPDENLIEVVDLKHTQAQTIAEKITALLKEEAIHPMLNNQKGDDAQAPPSVLKIEALEESNQLLISTNRKTFDKIITVLEKLDKPQPQVLVEAIIADVNDDFAKEFGTQMAGLENGGNNPVGLTNFEGTLSLSNVALAGFNEIEPENILLGEGLNIGLRVDDWAVLVSAIESNVNANVLSQPSIMTLNNHTARIFVGEDVPFISQITNNDNDTTSISRQDVGLELVVTPKVTSDDTLLMSIKQSIASVQPNAKTQVGAVDVITSNRELESLVRMESGKVVVLGGLISEELQTIRKKIPILGDIPILNLLFSYKSEQKRKASLVIFMRALIIHQSAQIEQQASELFERFKRLRLDGSLSGDVGYVLDGRGSLLDDWFEAKELDEKSLIPPTITFKGE